MREIKFRAWDEHHKEMTYDVIPVFTEAYIRDEEGQFRLVGPLNHLTQFTGLQDKNGTDIYEGDLIKFGSPRKTFSPLEPADKIAPVTYAYGSFNVDGNTLGEVTDWHECEVIANIYENPELLK